MEVNQAVPPVSGDHLPDYVLKESRLPLIRRPQDMGMGAELYLAKCYVVLARRADPQGTPLGLCLLSSPV
jgi:hypothetical protein